MDWLAPIDALLPPGFGRCVAVAQAQSAAVIYARGAQRLRFEAPALPLTADAAPALVAWDEAEAIHCYRQRDVVSYGGRRFAVTSSGPDAAGVSLVLRDVQRRARAERGRQRAVARQRRLEGDSLRPSAALF